MEDLKGIYIFVLTPSPLLAAAPEGLGFGERGSSSHGGEGSERAEGGGGHQRIHYQSPQAPPWMVILIRFVPPPHFRSNDDYLLSSRDPYSYLDSSNDGIRLRSSLSFVLPSFFCRISGSRLMKYFYFIMLYSLRCHRLRCLHYQSP